MTLFSGRIFISAALLYLSSVYLSVDSAELNFPFEYSSSEGVLDVDLYIKTCRAGEDILHDAPFKFNTRCFCYETEVGNECSSPGPTFRLQPGDSFSINIINDLGPNESGGQHNTMHNSNTTNIHTHGLHISSTQDNVLLSVEPGTNLKYEYDILDYHYPGSFWYHPHFHGSTAIQVSGGMAGAIIIEETESYALSDELESMDEKVMVLQHFSIGQNIGNPNFVDHIDIADLSDSTLNIDLEGSGETIMVNGQFEPSLKLAPGEWQRWRLIYAGHSNDLQLEIDGDCEMKHLASDGVYLDSVRDVPTVTFAPGSRRDVAIMCQSGVHYLNSVDVAGARRRLQGGGGGGGGNRGGSWAGTILTLDATGVDTRNMTFEDVTLPNKPPYLSSLLDETVPASNTYEVDFQFGATLSTLGFLLVFSFTGLSVPLHCFMFYTGRYHKLMCYKTRDASFQMVPMADSEDDSTKPDSENKENKSKARCIIYTTFTAGFFFIFGVIGLIILATYKDTYLANGSAYTNGDDIKFSMGMDEIWEWSVVGPHPFHIHVNHVQVQSDTDFEFTKGDWYDTLPATGLQRTIRTKPHDFTGKVVVHCHILGHEDHGMMQIGEVTQE